MSNVEAMNEKRVDLYPSRVTDKPSLLERKDPVVHGEHTENSLLTPEQLDFYENNGYLFLESFFTEEEVAVLSSEAKRLQEAGKALSSDEIIREPNGNEVRSIFAIHRQKGAFENLSMHDRLR